MTIRRKQIERAQAMLETGIISEAEYAEFLAEIGSSGSEWGEW